jgi:hypothetical protein
VAAFRVEKAYLVPHRDLIVLAGTPESGLPVPGGAIELPREIKGPGWVPIHAVQRVPFADRERLCVILEYAVVEGAPLMEFTDLEGLPLSLRGP